MFHANGRHVKNLIASDLQSVQSVLFGGRGAVWVLFF